MQLKQKYESACNEYLEIFCKKQGMDNEGWVADEIGGIAVCSDFYFNFHNIILDINSNQPKGKIIDWYHENLYPNKKTINYYHYTKGLMISDIS